MPRRKEPAIPADLLDQLLAGSDAASALQQGGLLDSLKKALAERALNAEMDYHLGDASQVGNSRIGYGRKTVVTDTGKIVLRHFLPHLNRDSIYRALDAEGLNRRQPKPTMQPRKGQGRFQHYDLGFVHIDIKHLPKLRTADGETRNRLYVAIDRCSRFVHLVVYDAENAANAITFLTAARKAFAFRGSCFTADYFERARARIKVIHRTTRPYTPQTNGMVERFNGRIAPICHCQHNEDTHLSTFPFAAKTRCQGRLLPLGSICAA